MHCTMFKDLTALILNYVKLMQKKPVVIQILSRDLDLEGAPYGYTPFCDSNKDMEGFRFWKQVWF